MKNKSLYISLTPSWVSDIKRRVSISVVKLNCLRTGNALIEVLIVSFFSKEIKNFFLD